MKKFLSIIFLMSAVVLPASSAVTNEEIMSDVFIRQHGHSEEMVRLIDLQSAQINGVPSKYHNQNPEWYQQQPFKSFMSSEVDYNEVQPIKFVRQVFTYFDKSLDDGKFMQNDIQYSTRYDDL